MGIYQQEAKKAAEYSLSEVEKTFSMPKESFMND